MKLQTGGNSWRGPEIARPSLTGGKYRDAAHNNC
jgi:hypothetical protein